MPHIIIKLYPGRSKEQKKQLASEIVKKVTEIAVCEEKSVSVAFEEVEGNRNCSMRGEISIRRI
jgi:4-oxalocrotonate tautomerase